ncbi:MAG: hypothetical protein LBE13_22640, partial [Bacteroidales bacterium]|nr:hypothetical protein [Bacteroidales bacterium]
MKASIIVCNAILPVEIYGGKAHWVSWLTVQGYTVPKSIFISCSSRDDALSDTKKQEFIDTLGSYIDVKNKYAVRSSGISEDSAVNSKAGNYKTFLNVEGVEDIVEKYLAVVGSVKDSNKKMGVVIQPMVDAKISGVVFSSDPNTGSKTDILLSYQYGLGEELVSGHTNGKDLIFIIDDSNSITCASNALDNPQFMEIAGISKKIENELNIPVDIEWCINQENKIVLLQCRPITSVYNNVNAIYKVNSQIKDIVPQRYLESDKIALRCIAEKHGVHVSDAYLLVCDLKEEKFPLTKISITKSDYYKSYNVVVLYPKIIDGKVMRSFVGTKENFCKSITCWRFGLRSLEDPESLKSCLERYYTLIKKYYWSCSIIIQEIYTPVYTGIIKKINDTFIIEVAKGHFVAKGRIPMSSYTLDKKGNTIYCNEIFQDTWTEIVEGFIVERPIDNEKITLDENIKKTIIQRFAPLFQKENITLEFGILRTAKEIIPYLIDYVADEKRENIDLSFTERGIISHGKITGKLVKLELKSFEDSLHSHFHNSQIRDNYEDIEPTIFYAEFPSIEFSDVLNTYTNKNIGFVFENGSILCHLS